MVFDHSVGGLSNRNQFLIVILKAFFPLYIAYKVYKVGLIEKTCFRPPQFLRRWWLDQ